MDHGNAHQQQQQQQQPQAANMSTAYAQGLSNPPNVPLRDALQISGTDLFPAAAARLADAEFELAAKKERNERLQTRFDASSNVLLRIQYYSTQRL